MRVTDSGRPGLALGCALCAALAGAALAGAGPAREPVPVQVQPLGELLVALGGDAPASVLSLNDAWLDAEISARIVALSREVGDRVRRNDVLLRLDCRTTEHQRAQAEAQLTVLRTRHKLAQQQLERARGLQRRQSIAEETVNQREAEAEALKAEIDAQRIALDIAAENVSRCVVRAPFAGVILERRAQVGELATPGEPLLRLLDTDKVELSARVEAGAMRSLERAARLSFDHRGERYALSLRSVLPALDAAADTRELRLVFATPPPLPGTSGRLVWSMPDAALPPQYLVRRAPGLGVLVADAGRARFVTLPRAREGRPADIDLDPATLVITAGRHGLTDGDPIDVRGD